MSIVVDPNPLKHEYIPKKIHNRKQEKFALTSLFTDIKETKSRNVYIYGNRGTGKSLLARKLIQELPDRINGIYLSCIEHDTQYKVLKEIYREVTGEKASSGHHTSKLQREIEKRSSEVETVIVLDEVDFLFLNEGDDLVYYLSRMDSELSVILISANHENPSEVMEERTYSSLYPQTISFEPYTGGEVYDILRARAQKSMKPRSLQQEALTYIASKTQNIRLGLEWLKHVAENNRDEVRESDVKEEEDVAYEKYVNSLLYDLSYHHKLLYDSIKKLATPSVNTGKVYQYYEEKCENSDKEPLTHRRVSDFLKHLELLGLIETDYFYGGEKGKTREIKMSSL